MIHTISFIVLNVLIQEFFNFPIAFKKHKEYEYHLSYKKVTFYYYMGSQTLVIRTETNKILNKGYANISDLKQFKEVLDKIIFEVTGMSNLKLVLNRVDYCVDLLLDEDNDKIEDTLELLYKHVDSYRHMKREKIYDSSIYLKTRRGNYNLNCYDKYEECQIDEFKGIFRIELQIKKHKIKRELKQYGVERTIDNYWTKEAMQEYYFDFLRGFFYNCDYYRIDVAIQKIKQSDYKESMKNKLIAFITKVNKNGMTETKKDYSLPTVKSYIKMLERIGLNPVTISIDKPYKKMENLLNRAKRIAEEIYFKKEGI